MISLEERPSCGEDLSLNGAIWTNGRCAIGHESGCGYKLEMRPYNFPIAVEKLSGIDDCPNLTSSEEGRSGFGLTRDELNVSGHQNGHNFCLWWGNMSYTKHSISELIVARQLEFTLQVEKLS